MLIFLSWPLLHLYMYCCICTACKKPFKSYSQVCCKQAKAWLAYAKLVFYKPSTSCFVQVNFHLYCMVEQLKIILHKHKVRDMQNVNDDRIFLFFFPLRRAPKDMVKTIFFLIFLGEIFELLYHFVFEDQHN